MKHAFTRHSLVAAVFSIFFLSVPLEARDGMKGEPDALRVARGIVQAVGGKEVWAPMRSLYVRQFALTPSISGQLTEEVWRDLEQPRERSEVRGEGLESIRVWQRSGGWWQHSSRGFRDLTPEEIAEGEAFWPGDVYIMYHRLAKEDPLLSLSLDDEGLLQINEGDVSRGWFQVNVSGEPIRWGLGTGTESVEYVFWTAEGLR